MEQYWENSVRRKFRTTKTSYDEDFVRRKIHTAKNLKVKVPKTKNPRAKIPTTKNPTAKIQDTDMFINDAFLIRQTFFTLTVPLSAEYFSVSMFQGSLSSC